MEVPLEIQGKYLERRKQDLEECLQSLETKNFTKLERTGHKLKGSASTFGHPELSSIGKKLEESAKIKDLSLLDQALKEYSHWVKSHIN